MKRLLLSIMFALFCMPAMSQSVPPLINYQGKLTDQTGAPLPAGSYGIQFRIWDDPLLSGTSDLIWDQRQTVTLQTNGVFNVILGAAGGSTIVGTTPAVNNLAYAFTGTNCFLGVTVAMSNGVSLGSATEIAPRQQLLSVPYAITARQAQVASELVTNFQNALCPPGTIVAFGGTNIPSGWLLCNGAALNLTNSLYANLFSAIGTAWGGDGITYFNLPDCRGVFLRGVNGSRNDSFADPGDSRINVFAGGNSGNAVGSYQEDMFKAHNHNPPGAAPTGFLTWWSPGGGANGADASLAALLNNGVGCGVDYETTTTGGSETRSKNAYVNYIIKY